MESLKNCSTLSFKNHKRMKLFKNNNKKALIPLLIIVLVVVLKYALFYINYEKLHIVVNLLSFSFYFLVLFYITRFLVKRKKIILANLSILVILFFVVELVCYLLLGAPKKEWKSYNLDDLPEDHIGTHLGHVPWADSVWHDVKMVDGKTIFDTYYTVDSLNRRVVPSYNASKSKYAAFFGCSICYGLGLKDDQTIPYYVQQNTNNYNSYNFSYTGWGCHHMLARMEHKDLSKEVREKEGVGIYIFLWSHIRRAIGDMRIYTGWGHTMPYYYLDDGEIKRDGNFKSGRPFLSKLYELLNRSFIVQYFELNFPFSTNETHMNLAAEIIKKAKATYIKQFGNDNFYVVIHPSVWTEFTDDNNKKFKAILKEKGINVLDYSKRIPLDNDHIIVGDGHPNELSNQKFAKMLVEDLKLN